MVCEAPKLPQTLVQAVRHFADPAVAESYVAAIKWPSEPCCGKCGSVNVGHVKGRNVYQCRERGCRYQSRLKHNTIMQDSPLKVDQWLIAIWQIANCKNGISSCELARALGIKQQSAWHVLHRVRAAMKETYTEKIGQRHGAVESDSTFVGGEFKFMSYERRERAAKSERPHNKSVVHALRDRRTSTVRATVIPGNKTEYIQENVHNHVAKGARIYTDCGRENRWVYGSGYYHDSVNHSILEYVRGEVSTNGCENFFNCLRRALKGTYVKADPEHLAAYVDEQVFRFNHRSATDWERFDRLARCIVGKRLTYSELTDGAKR